MSQRNPLYMFLYMFGLIRSSVSDPTRDRRLGGLWRGSGVSRPYQVHRGRSALERHLARIIGGVPQSSDGLLLALC